MNKLNPIRKDLHLLLQTPGSNSQHLSPKVYAGTTYSPVTDLAMNLGELCTNTFEENDDTPKRRLSLSSAEGTPTPIRPVALVKQLSMDDERQVRLYVDEHLRDMQQLGRKAGCCMDSPVAAIDSPYFESRLLSGKSKNERSPLELKSSAFRRFQSMPLPFCDCDDTVSSPDSDATSPDSAVSSVTPEKSLPKPCFFSLGNSSTSSPDLARLERSPESFLTALPRRERTPERSPRRQSLTPEKSPKSLFHVEDDSSQDSGVGLDKESASKDSSLLPFVKPVGPAPRIRRVLSDETNSPLKYSPFKGDDAALVMRPVSAPASSLDFGASLLEQDSPIKLRKSSLTASPETDDGDDGFLDLVDEEVKPRGPVPQGLEGLFSGPVLSSPVPKVKLAERRSSKGNRENQENEAPRLGSTRRGLFRSNSDRYMSPGQGSPCYDIRSRPFTYKRAEPCTKGQITPLLKRRKSVADVETPEAVEKRVTPRTLQRCQSMLEANIKTALDREDDQAEGELIGDFSRTYCLPMVRGKKQDLKSIAPTTVAAILNGEYEHVIENCTIIDCRYPYEYEGGHIKDALNIYTKDETIQEFVTSDKYRQAPPPGKRNILIFHCEFSSERGPSMSRFLRNQDRDANKDCYPSLYYPEVYLLDNGYKAFYEQHPELCVPQEYKPMLHEDHASDLKHFRAKSKSWAGERCQKGGRVPFRRGLRT